MLIISIFLHLALSPHALFPSWEVVRPWKTPALEVDLYSHHPDRQTDRQCHEELFQLLLRGEERRGKERRWEGLNEGERRARGREEPNCQG